MSEEENAIQFLKDNPEFFINKISADYSLSDKMVDKYCDLFSWQQLSCNSTVPRSMDFYLKYEDKWEWGDGDKDEFPRWINDNKALPWSSEFLEWNKTKIQWESISQSDDLFKWSYDLIKRYQDYWYWKYLSENEAIPWTLELLADFEERWDWRAIAKNPKIKWTNEMINRFRHRLVDKEVLYIRNPELSDELRFSSIDVKARNPPKEVKYSSAQMNTIMRNPDWWEISHSERIPWSAMFIENNKDNFYWDALSRNESLPWTIEIIDKYSERWEWGGEILEDDGSAIIVQGLSYNSAIPWSVELIEKYSNKWYWSDLSHIPGMPWTLELLEHFKEQWEWIILTYNYDMWRKVFESYIDDEVTKEILDHIKSSH